MNVLAFVLILIAAVLFGINAWITKSLVALGLCLLSVGFIVQFAATSHTFTF
jgi:uncharacterized membrane protein YGL010W